MKYWQYIELPGWEAECEKLREWVLAGPILKSKQFWNVIDPHVMAFKTTRLGELLREHLDSKCVYCAVIVSHSYTPLSIHIDYMAGVQARLQLPIMNTAGTKTLFYTADRDKVKTVYMPNNAHFYHIEQKDATLVDSVEVNQPTVLRIDQPHAVIANRRASPRITLTLRLDRDPVRFIGQHENL